jgi:cytochrome b561
MRLRNSPSGYGAVPQVCHWLTVGLVIMAWALGILGDELPKGALYSTALSFHIFAGLMILAILVVRLLWRLADSPPTPEPTALGEWLDRAGRLTHYVLYALLIAVPVAGIALQFSRGGALPLFGLIEIPSPWPPDRAIARTAKEAHEVLANFLVILAGIHAVAALVHHWLLGDRTLVRMLWKSSR